MSCPRSFALHGDGICSNMDSFTPAGVLLSKVSGPGHFDGIRYDLSRHHDR